MRGGDRQSATHDSLGRAFGFEGLYVGGLFLRFVVVATGFARLARCIRISLCMPEERLAEAAQRVKTRFSK